MTAWRSSEAVYDLQAVASMLLGIRPDVMMEEHDLMGWNPDKVEGPGVTWPYPPVLLLEATEDWSNFRDRVRNTERFFIRQVCSGSNEFYDIQHLSAEHGQVKLCSASAAHADISFLAGLQISLL